MRHKIEQKEAIRIVGVRTALQEDIEQNFETVPRFWDTILKSKKFSQICGLTNQNPNGTAIVLMVALGIIFFYTSSKMFAEMQKIKRGGAITIPSLI